MQHTSKDGKTPAVVCFTATYKNASRWKDFIVQLEQTLLTYLVSVPSALILPGKCIFQIKSSGSLFHKFHSIIIFAAALVQFCWLRFWSDCIVIASYRNFQNFNHMSCSKTVYELGAPVFIPSLSKHQKLRATPEVRKFTRSLVNTTPWRSITSIKEMI